MMSPPQRRPPAGALSPKGFVAVGESLTVVLLCPLVSLSISPVLFLATGQDGATSWSWCWQSWCSPRRPVARSRVIPLTPPRLLRSPLQRSPPVLRPPLQPSPRRCRAPPPCLPIRRRRLPRRYRLLQRRRLRRGYRLPRRHRALRPRRPPPWLTFLRNRKVWC